MSALESLSGTQFGSTADVPDEVPGTVTGEIGTAWGSSGDTASEGSGIESDEANDSPTRPVNVKVKSVSAKASTYAPAIYRAVRPGVGE